MKQYHLRLKALIVLVDIRIAVAWILTGIVSRSRIVARSDKPRTNVEVNQCHMRSIRNSNGDTENRCVDMDWVVSRLRIVARSNKLRANVEMNQSMCH